MDTWANAFGTLFLGTVILGIGILTIITLFLIRPLLKKALRIKNSHLLNGVSGVLLYVLLYIYFKNQYGDFWSPIFVTRFAPVVSLIVFGALETFYKLKRLSEK